jgi:hypothetical protein
MRPEKRNPKTGEAFTDLKSGITNTVAAKNVKKSSPRGSSVSGAALAKVLLLEPTRSSDPTHGLLAKVSR